MEIRIEDSMFKLVLGEGGSRMLREYEVLAQCFTEKSCAVVGNDFV